MKEHGTSIGPNGVSKMLEEDSLLGGARNPHQKANSAYAKILTLGASPSFGGRRAAATSEVGASVKLVLRRLASRVFT